MLRYGRYRVHLDTVPEGVLVSVHDNDGLVCEVIDVDAMVAVRAALAAAQADDEDDDYESRN